MSIKNVVAALRQRMPWHLGRKVLEKNHLPFSRGWENTEAALLTEDGLAETEAALQSILIDHVIAGQKLVRFFRCKPGVADALRAAADELKISSGPAADRYPLLMTATERQKQSSAPVLVAREKRSKGTALIFSSVKELEFRDKIPIEKASLSADEVSRFSKYREIVGVRLEKIQLMNVLWIPARGSVVEVRVDQVNGVKTEDAGEALAEFLAHLGHQFKNWLQLDPLNLFPLVAKMYWAKEEGIVTNLHFLTQTGSIKRETMRQQDDCLRKEGYHKGGKHAVKDQISPYRLGLSWSFPEDEDKESYSRPELSLLGAARMLQMPSPVLDSAIIGNCIGLDDYDFVRRKIISYLNSAAED